MTPKSMLLEAQSLLIKADELKFEDLNEALQFDCNMAYGNPSRHSTVLYEEQRKLRQAACYLIQCAVQELP